MSSLVTQAFIFERYGPRLNVASLSELLGMSPGALHNQRSAGTFPIKMYPDAGKLFADYRDVAEHFDAMRKLAT